MVLSLRTAFAILLVLAVSLAQGAVVIVDNTDGAPGFTSTGTWQASTGVVGYYGANFFHNNQDAASVATYTPNLPTADIWTVWARWTANGNREDAVPYTIYHDGGSAVVTKDQRASGSSWQKLGDYAFQAGTGGSVVVSAVDGTGYVVADAIAFSTGNNGDTGFIDPSTLTAYASSFYPSGNRGPSQAVNGAGMEDTLETYHLASNNGNDYNWMSEANDPDLWFKVDLGQEYQLGSMKVWNFSTSNDLRNRQVQTANLYVSTLASPSNTFTNAAEWTLVESNALFTKVPTGVNKTSELFDFGASGVPARWVALDILSNYGDSFTGLGELRFYPLVQQVPEPTSLALVLSGVLAALAYVARGFRAQVP